MYEGNFGATLRSLRRHFYHVKQTSGSPWDHFSHMMMTLWQLWGHFVVTFWHLRAALGTLWDHFGSTMGVTLGDVASHDGHFAMIVESLWVYKGPFSKNTHYPHRF